MYKIVVEVLALLLSFLTYRYYFFLSSRDEKRVALKILCTDHFDLYCIYTFLLDRTMLRVYYYLLVNSRIYVFIMYPPICAHKSDCTHTLHSNRIVLNTLIHMYWIQILQYVHHRLDVQISCICISISLSAGLHHPILMQHMHKDWNYYIGLYK